MIPIYHWNSQEIRDYLKKVCSRGLETPDEVEEAVARIIASVRQGGDDALLELTNEFDGVRLESLRINPVEIRSLAARTDPELRKIIRRAKENIRSFHQRQLERSWEFEAEEGVRLGQRIRPLQSVGIYITGGKAAYPSTILMNALPAQIAGVSRIVVATPYQQFHQNPVLAAVLEDLNLTEVYGVGGAQAVAALAYGTVTIPKVDKIVGPGNIYVTTAKRQVFGIVDIDMIAGPTEVMVIADDSVDPYFVAADQLAQPAHA